MKLLNWIFSFFIKKTNLIMNEGKVKYRVHGYTAGLWFFDFCILGAWFNFPQRRTGVVWLGEAYLLIVENE